VPPLGKGGFAALISDVTGCAGCWAGVSALGTVIFSVLGAVLGRCARDSAVLSLPLKCRAVLILVGVGGSASGEVGVSSSSKGNSEALVVGACRSAGCSEEVCSYGNGGSAALSVGVGGYAWCSAEVWGFGKNGSALVACVWRCAGYSEGVSAFGNGKPEAFAVGRGKCAGGSQSVPAYGSGGSAASAVGLGWCQRDWVGVSPLGNGRLAAMVLGVGERARGWASVSELEKGFVAFRMVVYCICDAFTWFMFFLGGLPLPGGVSLLHRCASTAVMVFQAARRVGQLARRGCETAAFLIVVKNLGLRLRHSGGQVAQHSVGFLV